MTSNRRFLAGLTGCFAIGIVLFCGGGTAAVAQDDDFRLPGPVPAPIRFVPGDQRSRLGSETDIKKRAKLFLEFAEARLNLAETLTTQKDFTGAAIELGNYQGLVHESIVFLQAQPNSGKTRDLFKNLELALRTYCPRLEGIRRGTPLSYGSDVKDVLRFTEDSRDVSLNSFFGDTVLREPSLTNNPTPKPAQ